MDREEASALINAKMGSEEVYYEVTGGTLLTTDTPRSSILNNNVANNFEQETICCRVHLPVGLRNEKEAVSDQVSIVYIYSFAMLYGV